MGDLTPALGPAVGIVCGMVSEVRALGRWADDPRITIAVSGARPERAEAEARRLVAEGCRALMSWGVAGGLDPALVPVFVKLDFARYDETVRRHAEQYHQAA